MNVAVLFERDGVLNRIRAAKQLQITPQTWEEFELNLEALEPLWRLKRAGFLLLATTNQPALSQTPHLRREVERMHQCLLEHLPLDGILTCPHEPNDDCPCHKPRPGLYREAAHRWKLDLTRCFVVSDKWQDARAAHAVGAMSMLLQSPWNGNGHHDVILPSLDRIADKILSLRAALVA
jgi:D-glycero-D-manno-heptose 1,7-bisphosphate phosphatase